MSRPLRVLTLLCFGCAPAHAPVVTSLSAADAASTRGGAPATRPATEAREVVRRKDSYAELVRSATELENAQRETRACLLQEVSSGYRLRAAVSSAVRPLPAPPEDLDEALKNAERVELLSAWGRYGDGNGKLALAAFTGSAPAHDALAVLLTDRGIALRGPSGSQVAPLDGLDVPRLLAALNALDARSSASVFLAAEARVPLTQVYGVLTALAEQQREVVLAVPLSSNTTLPLPASATAKVPLCGDGLSATDAAEGSLPAGTLMAEVAPLREHAADCLARGDARGAAGGKLSLALRVAADGHVQEACITRDELADAAVLSCVIGLASQLRFTPPSPSGVVDLELPIVLRASPQAVQHPTCGPSDP